MTVPLSRHTLQALCLQVYKNELSIKGKPTRFAGGFSFYDFYFKLYLVGSPFAGHYYFREYRACLLPERFQVAVFR